MKCKVIMNSEWVLFWKEVVVAYFEVLSMHLHGKTKERHDILSFVSNPVEFRTQHLPNIYIFTTLLGHVI